MPALVRLQWRDRMNTNEHACEIQLLGDLQLDEVTGGSIISTVVQGAAAAARGIGNLLGTIVTPTFPIDGGLKGAVKAGPQIGKMH
jgi:hypothetical protein